MSHDVPPSSPTFSGGQPPVGTGQQPPPGWGPPGFAYPVAVPPRGHSTSTVVWAAVGALVIGLLSGAGIVGAVWAFNVVPGAEQSENVPAASDTLPDRLPDLLAFVEDERDLTFRDDVDVEFLTGREFDDAFYGIESESAADDEPLPEIGETYAALGLTPDADSYYSALTGAGTDGVAGFYDPATERLVVRGEEWTPVVEATLIHELTHALQDQHFDLAAMTADPGSPLAVRALVEGDADSVEASYVENQDGDWQDEYYEAWEQYSYSGTYDPLADTLGWFPYEYGTQMVDQLNREGALDEAFRDPPTTDEQVFYVREWVDGDPEAAPAIHVDRPEIPDDVDVIDEGTLGAMLLAMLALDLEVDYYQGQVLPGWRGDTYVTWADDGDVCTDVAVRFDDAYTRNEAATLWGAWTSEDEAWQEPGNDDDELLLHSCQAAS